jgi:hypothetical protein
VEPTATLRCGHEFHNGGTARPYTADVVWCQACALYQLVAEGAPLRLPSRWGWCPVCAGRVRAHKNKLRTVGDHPDASGRECDGSGHPSAVPCRAHAHGTATARITVL